MLEPIIIKEKISEDKLKEIAEKNSLGNMIKLVVDVKKEILSLGCELRVDCMQQLLDDGSHPKNLWGANIYLSDKKIDFVSLINIRPADNNRSMEIKIPEIKEKVGLIIKKLLF